MHSLDRCYRLVLVAVVLPAVIVLVDQLALRFAERQHWSLLAVALIYTLFVGQVALLGLVVGGNLEHPLLRWTVFAWAVVLIDILIFRILCIWSSANCLAFALVSGQVGLLAIWGTLGAAPWPWRLPAVVVAAVSLASMCFASAGSGTEVWTYVLLLQSAVVAGVCVLASALGFRLERPHEYPTSNADVPIRRRLQFTIGHMFVWTAALVPVLVLGRGLDLDVVQDIGWEGIPITVLLGGCVGVVSVVAMWAAVGTGSALVRLVLLALVPPTLGIVLVTMFAAWRPAPGVSWWQQPGGHIADVTDLGLWWVAWTCLAAWFLAGLLLVFRASGYRLMRRGRASVGKS